MLPSPAPPPPPDSEQVPFGPLAFMPGKLVHTNEVTALLGDNWFARCSAKQAQKLVAHRMKCEFSPNPSCNTRSHPAEGAMTSNRAKNRFK